MINEIEVIMTETRTVPDVGVLVSGVKYSLAVEFANQLIAQGCAIAATSAPTGTSGKKAAAATHSED